MGLDAVEMVMEVEETFDIQLDDADAEKMETPRDLIEAVWNKVNRADSTGCLTQRAFNLLRRFLLEHQPVKRGDIVPTVRLKNLVGKHDRNSWLGQLAAALDTGPLPKLVRPKWLVCLLAGFSVAVGLGAMAGFLRLTPGLSWGWYLFFGSVVAALAGFLAAGATARFCTEFPPLVATVGDLSRWIVSHKNDLAGSTPGRWTREQVATRIREIVISYLDCAAAYREDASFVRDLGLS